MMERLSESRLAGTPRLLDLRRELSEDALGFYDRIFRQAQSDDPLYRADTGRRLSTWRRSCNSALGTTSRRKPWLAAPLS